MYKVKKMKEHCNVGIIYLSKGQIAVVDIEDYEELNKDKWYASYSPKLGGYYAGAVKRLMHREIINPGDKIVDHKNRKTLDNRKSNLRVCTRRQNMQNRKDTKRFPGASYHKKKEKWVAQIKIKGRKKHLSYAPDPITASIIYEFSVREIDGEELICKAKNIYRKRYI